MIILHLHPVSKNGHTPDSVAQLVEHYTFNVGVLGSNPSGITEIFLFPHRFSGGDGYSRFTGRS